MRYAGNIVQDLKPGDHWAVGMKTYDSGLHSNWLPALALYWLYYRAAFHLGGKHTENIGKTGKFYLFVSVECLPKHAGTIIFMTRPRCYAFILVKIQETEK